MHLNSLPSEDQSLLLGSHKQYAPIVAVISQEVAQGTMASANDALEAAKALPNVLKMQELNDQKLTKDEIELLRITSMLRWTDEQTKKYFIARHEIDGG